MKKVKKQNKTKKQAKKAICSSYSVIIQVRVVLKRTVVGD